MKVYKSNSVGFSLNVLIAMAAIVLTTLVLLYFRHLWYILVVFITPFMFLPLIFSQTLLSYYFVENGYLVKQYDKKNFAGKDTAFKMKLTEIVKIEKRKNLFGTPFIALYYSDNQAIDIYLKADEINEFIKEVSQK